MRPSRWCSVVRAAICLAAAPALAADDSINVGALAELSGPFAPLGKQITDVIRAYMAARGPGARSNVMAPRGLSMVRPLAAPVALSATITIDPATRDGVQDVYVRKVERVGGKLHNVEVDCVPRVKDPGKA